MVSRKHSNTRTRPRGQKPMVRAAPASDHAAANALSSHVRPKSSSDGLTRKARKTTRIKTHGPLGNVRVDKRAQAHGKGGKRAATKNGVKPAAAAAAAAVDQLKLNTALKPAGIVHRRGKKGKVFADDKDTLTKVLTVVTARMDEIHATKIERAQQLEAIRDAKRKEVEKREQQKVDRLEQKKKEIKHSKRKHGNQAGAKSEADDGDSGSGKSGGKRRVRFSV
ncbi:hypothetical protein V1506DRAFT_556919 [Lipomyces tetrasporus]